MRFVAYLRVSTDRQGKSGLGLEAQRRAVQDYLTARNGEMLAEYVEVESGKVNERPQLALAMADAKRAGAVLLIAKLDRLARNVAFIANLLEAGVEVAAADLPEANRFVLHIMAAMAEEEGRMISARTKAALAAAKARGVSLGWAMPSRRDEQRSASRKGVQATTRAADTHASNILPMVRQIADSGASLHQIAAELNRRGINTARGGKWYATTVRNLMVRDAATALRFAENEVAQGHTI
ncbi:recombinase family protein [uncultured Paracoccus sp.]|uniref:recombinase family protein n=1 Tax=uncultured Paracoccus sp. TaxID=189685 RepID=UPI00260A4A3A|nr:recombinase family protein [uncultured Paracoccus sp.]